MYCRGRGFNCNTCDRDCFDERGRAGVKNSEGSEELKANTDNIKMAYEVEKLKAKINLSANILKAVDTELLELNLYENEDLDDIAEKIMNVRDGLRDLIDFMRKSD